MAGVTPGIEGPPKRAFVFMVDVIALGCVPFSSMTALAIVLVSLALLTLVVWLTLQGDATWSRARGRGPPRAEAHMQMREYAVNRPVELRIVRDDGQEPGSDHIAE